MSSDSNPANVSVYYKGRDGLDKNTFLTSRKRPDCALRGRGCAAKTARVERAPKG